MDASAYLSQLIGLLPPGDALVREPGSVLERLLSVPAAELARVDGRVEALLTESDPARTAEMLADWERALGLPDVCYPNFQFSRASRGWYFDGAGVLREAAVDEPRYLYDANGQRTEAVLVEGAATNHVVQPFYQAAVAGAWAQAQG
ncbi:MAG: putative phage tail protein, partial [Acetobacteraceae bacterium]